MSTTKPVWGTVNDKGRRGWIFGKDDNSKDLNCEDPLYGKHSIADIYLMDDPEFDGRFTVPLLWDKKTKTIVSNESLEIIKMFNTAFNELAKNPSIDLYPEAHQKEIDEMNDWVYNTINNGVYKCGFAST